MPDALRVAYADPPYLGQCKSYGHVHNDGGPMPWDGRCWDDVETHHSLLVYVADHFDGWAYSCNPSHLPWASQYGRVAAWCKSWHQIRPTSTQYAWEPVIFHDARPAKRSPMVRDWLVTPATRGTGQRGAKPREFNAWVLDLVGYREGDELTDLFPGSGGMGRAAAMLRLAEEDA